MKVNPVYIALPALVAGGLMVGEVAATAAIVSAFSALCFLAWIGRDDSVAEMAKEATANIQQLQLLVSSGADVSARIVTRVDVLQEAVNKLVTKEEIEATRGRYGI